MNLLAAASPASVTVNTAGVYTRSSGSFLTDGFFVGQVVSWTGFVNGANNQSNVTITALTATVMTVGGVTIAETSTATTVAGQSPVLDGTFSLQMTYVCTNVSGHSQAIKDLRTTLI
ncbi:MAG TPA: hypothetical protein VIV58_31195 [Kofleriaceae bacterium]